MENLLNIGFILFLILIGVVFFSMIWGLIKHHNAQEQAKNVLKLYTTLLFWGLAAFYIFEFLYGKERFDLLTFLFAIVVFTVSQMIQKLYKVKS